MKRRIKKKIKKTYQDKYYYLVVDGRTGLFSNGGINPEYNLNGKIFTRIGDAKRSYQSLENKVDINIVELKVKVKKIKEII